MSMKVAIITPYSTGNIGTVLQAYATQHLVKEAGYDNRIVDYVWDNIENPFRIENMFRRGVKSYFAAIFGHLTRLPKRKKLSRFINDHMTLTESFKHDELNRLENEFDYFLVGSDCVWNAEAFGFEKAYFLDFVSDDNRKGNYASSFAADSIPGEYEDKYREYLNRFNQLSVREIKGQELIWELIQKEAVVVLDPTLTLDSAFWDKICLESRIKVPEKYIFVAEYSYSPQMWRDAEKLAEKYDCQIVGVFPPKGKIKVTKTYLSAGPQDFLYLIKNSLFVLTDSYHMTIFSINFNKEFVSYITNTALPSLSKYDSIMSLLAIEGRMVHENDSRYELIEDVRDLPPIDYSEINARLVEQRVVSKRYLRSLLDGAKDKIRHNS